MSESVTPVRDYVVVYVLLMLLLAATYGLSYADLGSLNTGLSFAIAAAKAALIVAFFMHLRQARGLTRAFAATGVFWLGILFVLSLSDYLTRDWLALPGYWP